MDSARHIDRARWRALTALATASAATAAGCEPIVHGYRTGVFTSVLVVGIVIAFIAVLIARVGRPSVHPPRPRRRTRHHRA